MTTKMPPVILFGHGRSGTSILSGLMRDHLGVAFGTESQFVINYYHRMWQYAPLDCDDNLARLIDHLLKERWFRRSRKFNDFQLDRETIMAAVKERTYAGVLDAIFSLFATHLEMQRWGDKTPSYINDLEIIHRLFPQAKYVHLVRDGRDVALSLSKIYFGPKSVFTAAVRWRETVEKGARFAASLPPGQVLSLRYEDMLSAPRQFFTTLAEFLQISDREAAQLQDGLASKLKTTNYNKWKHQWSPRKVAAFERFAGTELRRCGYETLTDQASTDGTLWQSVVWKTHDELLRWKYPRYWADNFYKARCAARHIYHRLA